MSVTTDAIKHAAKVGYKITKSGRVLYKDRPRKHDHDNKGYLRFRIRDKRKKVVNIPVHRLQAYQKFGDDVFNDGIQVRHLDGNPLNNSWGNIAIGSQSDNMMDRPSSERLASAMKATRVISVKVLAGGIEFPSYLAAGRYFRITDNGIRRRIQLGWDGYKEIK